MGYFCSVSVYLYYLRIPSSCCPERINTSAVPTALRVFFQLPRSCLIYPGFSEPWEQQDNSEGQGSRSSQVGVFIPLSTGLWMDHWQWGIVIGKNLCILLLEHSITWAFNIQRRSWPERVIGHSSTYEKLCFRVRSIRKLISSFPDWSVVPRVPMGKLELGYLKSKGVPGLVHSSESLSSLWEALGFLLLFQPRAVFFLMTFHPVVSTLFPPWWWLICLLGYLLLRSQWCCQKSVFLFSIFILLLFPFEHFKSNIYQLIKCSF